jgi:hypothetical protein
VQTYYRIVIEQCSISHIIDALSSAERSLREVLSHFKKALDTSSGSKPPKDFVSIATQNLVEVLAWLKLANLPISDISDVIGTSAVEHALLVGSVLSDSAAGTELKSRIQKHQAELGQICSLVMTQANKFSEKQKTLELDSATAHKEVGAGLTAVQDLRWKMFLDKVNKPEEETDATQA